MILLDLTLDELKNVIKDLGEPAFRAAQIYSWLNMGVPFEEMTNLSKALREKLRAEYLEGYPNVVTVRESLDGTKKYLFAMQDGSLVESVLMRYEYGNTVCISSQAGCAMGCRFCASTKGGLIRNLSAGEILSQVVAINALEGSGRSVKNVVMMGTGEPFHNYDNVVKAIRLMHAEKGLNISARNISLSTCGLIDGIKKFADEGLPVTLCLSLHSAFDVKRRQIMPVADRYSVKETVAAMRRYYEKTGRRVIFEYILIKDFNDGEEDILELKKLSEKMACHVNLIPYNKVDGVPFEAPTVGHTHAFAAKLNENGVSATVRRSLGRDIDGACGQLRARTMQL